MAFSRTWLAPDEHAYLGGRPVIKPNPREWDILTARIFMRGTRAQFLAKFGPGQNPQSEVGSFPSLYAVEPQIEREEEGHIWATIEYKGFASTSQRDRAWSHAVTTRETMWPQQSGSYTAFVPAALLAPPFRGANPNVNPSTGEFWRVRLIDQLAGLTIRGASITPGTQPPPPPVVPANIRPVNKPFNFTGLQDPVLNAPRGWVLRNYDAGEPIICPRPSGILGLYFWTASFEWVPDWGP